MSGESGLSADRNARAPEKSEMRTHTDVFGCFRFDQARYFYDLVPTLPLLLDRLRFPDQCILRVCMDGIFRHTAQVCGEPKFGSSKQTLILTGL